MIIDAHVHTYPSIEIGQRAVGGSGYGCWGTIPEIESLMEESGISKVIMSSLVPIHAMKKYRLSKISPGSIDNKKRNLIADLDETLVARVERRNSWICRVSDNHSRLRSLITLDVLQSPEQMQREVEERVLGSRAQGLKIHPVMNEHYPWDKRLTRIYATAQKFKIPVLFHSGPSELSGYNEEYGRLGHFERVADAFPDLNIVLAHLGKGGFDRTVRMAQRYPNIFFDTSGCLFWPEHPKGKLIQRIFSLIKEIGAEKVLFGSDWPWHNPLEDIKVIRSMGFNHEEEAMILGLNAERVYKV